MAPRKKNPQSGKRNMLVPVAALTRYRPDISDLSSNGRDQAALVRHGVKVGDTGIFLPYLEKVEIVEMDSVCPVPNTPMWFMGMINNRGHLLPVFDLKLYLALDVDQPARWLMIQGYGGKAAGLCIDTLPVVIDNPEAADTDRMDAQMAIPHALRAHVTGTYVHNGRTWLDVSYDKLFHAFCAGF